jgi:hypothetical protein
VVYLCVYRNLSLSLSLSHSLSSFSLSVCPTLSESLESVFCPSSGECLWSPVPPVSSWHLRPACRWSSGVQPLLLLWAVTALLRTGGLRENPGESRSCSVLLTSRPWGSGKLLILGCRFGSGCESELLSAVQGDKRAGTEDVPCCSLLIYSEASLGEKIKL